MALISEWMEQCGKKVLSRDTPTQETDKRQLTKPGVNYTN